MFILNSLKCLLIKEFILESYPSILLEEVTLFKSSVLESKLLFYFTARQTSDIIHSRNENVYDRDRKIQFNLAMIWIYLEAILQIKLIVKFIIWSYSLWFCCFWVINLRILLSFLHVRVVDGPISQSSLKKGDCNRMDPTLIDILVLKN